MTYYDLFDLPPSYPIDLTLLEKRYFALQLKYHPDRAQSDEEKVKFSSASAAINEAYNILKNDYGRAVYLLKLHNIDLAKEGVNYPLPPEALQEIWDAREAMEETEDLRSFLAHKLKQREQLIVTLSSVFDIANYNKAAILTLMLKYLDNLIAATKEKMA